MRGMRISAELCVRGSVYGKARTQKRVIKMSVAGMLVHAGGERGVPY